MSNIQCHDCKISIKSGSKYAEYDASGSHFYKCALCYKKDPILRNYRQTEVYSRVVGYIRPVAQWNKGKQAEFGDRKEFATAEACACA